MRVLGIDCGTECTGYGVVEDDERLGLVCVSFHAVRLSPKQPMASRLAEIYERLEAAITEYRPHQVAIEDVFYSANVKSALKLGQARGVAMLAAANAGLPVWEYAPLSIKSAVVGYGRAEKSQVQLMVATLLRLPEPPTPFDAADALAIAICHLHTSTTQQKQGHSR